MIKPTQGCIPAFIPSATVERPLLVVPAPLEWPPMTKPIKVALARIPADMDTEPEVIALVRTAPDHFASAGYDVTEADVPDLDLAALVRSDHDRTVGASGGADARTR